MTSVTSVRLPPPLPPTHATRNANKDKDTFDTTAYSSAFLSARVERFFMVAEDVVFLVAFFLAALSSEPDASSEDSSKSPSPSVFTGALEGDVFSTGTDEFLDDKSVIYPAIPRAALLPSGLSQAALHPSGLSRKSFLVFVRSCASSDVLSCLCAPVRFLICHLFVPALVV